MKLEDVLFARSSHFRLKRMRRFIEAFSITDTTHILDVGGEPAFWAAFPFKANITLLNTSKFSVYPNCCLFVVADGRSLPFPPSSFDIVFSNSVIEHLGTFQDQQLFAKEIRRIARSIWVQTPARWFPIEPHLAGLFIHYLPKRLQRKLAKRLTLWGWIATDYDRDIDIFLKEVRLLTYKEMKELFPDCEIMKERWLLLTKAYIAVRKPLE
jgi:hypothetical protein